VVWLALGSINIGKEMGVPVGGAVKFPLKISKPILSPYKMPAPVSILIQNLAVGYHQVAPVWWKVARQDLNKGIVMDSIPWSQEGQYKTWTLETGLDSMFGIECQWPGVRRHTKLTLLDVSSSSLHCSDKNRRDWYHI